MKNAILTTYKYPRQFVYSRQNDKRMNDTFGYRQIHDDYRQIQIRQIRTTGHKQLN
jgi:hypothetical protein